MRTRLLGVLKSLFFVPIPPIALQVFEAGVISLFFVQALRFLIGGLYSHISSAAITTVLPPESIPTGARGVVDAATVSTEITLLGVMFALPLLALILGRRQWLMLFAAIGAAVTRYWLIAPNAPFNSVIASELTVGFGLLYIALLVRQRAPLVPVFFVLGFGLDQILRAAGNTLDISWSSRYLQIQTILSLAVGVAALLLYVKSKTSVETKRNNPNYGLLNFWGGIGFGALLFLEASLLALPNAISGRAQTDYSTFVPFVAGATVLPLIPWVRIQGRKLIGIFDASMRGWAWVILLALLIVVGTRVNGYAGGAALVIAQLGVVMIWWWLPRQQAEQERNWSGLWVALGMLVFVLLVVGDFFTYEYAFVRDFAPPLDFLNSVIPPILRGMRGMGLMWILFATFLACLPIIQTRRRIPWKEGGWVEALLGLVAVIGIGGGAAFATLPPVIEGVRNTESLRIGTYNIHAGFSEFFDYDLERIAETIATSGADVVLLQEVEAGRLTSFGVDQALWLARTLKMDERFYPTNEGLLGLAVLSRVEIVFSDGVLLDSTALQTGLQRVQILPDSEVITIYNTWLSPLLEETIVSRTTAQQEQDQIVQLNEILGIIEAHHSSGILGRTVLGGTFNNVPDSDLIMLLQSTIFRDAFAGQPLDDSFTVERTGLRARLDYLWVANLTVEGAIVMDGDGSDHRMAVIGVNITR